MRTASEVKDIFLEQLSRKNQQHYEYIKSKVDVRVNDAVARTQPWAELFIGDLEGYWYDRLIGDLAEAGYDVYRKAHRGDHRGEKYLVITWGIPDNTEVENLELLRRGIIKKLEDVQSDCAQLSIDGWQQSWGWDKFGDCSYQLEDDDF